MKRMNCVVLVVALAALCGCQSPMIEVVAPPAVEAAACVLLAKKPAATPYVSLVAEVFTEFGSGEPPTAERLQAALSGLPGGGLDKPTATAVWAGAVVAYRALHEGSASSAKRERLVALLDSIGTALRAAVESCGTPAARAVGGSVKRAEVEPLAEAIAAELRQAPR